MDFNESLIVLFGKSAPLRIQRKERLYSPLQRVAWGEIRKLVFFRALNFAPEIAYRIHL